MKAAGRAYHRGVVTGQRAPRVNVHIDAECTHTDDNRVPLPDFPESEEA